MRSAFRGPAHQLAVRMRINNMAIIIIMAQATSHAPCASNCTCAEGLHFSAFHLNSNRTWMPLEMISGLLNSVSLYSKIITLNFSRIEPLKVAVEKETGHYNSAFMWGDGVGEGGQF